MSLAPLLVGAAAGAAAGAWNARDLSRSVAGFAGGGSRITTALGLFRRTAILAAALLGSLLLGPWAWAGVAAGYLAGFTLLVAREARVRVR